jgi:hypothetical protein
VDQAEYLLKLERNLMMGSARWITGFNESYRDHVVDGVRFDMLVRGKTRVKGFFLSNIMSYFILPNYLAACFVCESDRAQRGLHPLLGVVSRYMDAEGLKWCWLVILGHGSFPSKLRKAVVRNSARELGVALVDLDSQEIVTNPSFMGKRMVRHIRCFK